MNSAYSFHRPQLEHAFLTRRQFLSRCGMGFGAIGLTAMLGSMGLVSATPKPAQRLNPLAPKAPSAPARAKHLIHIFLNGGPSQVDLFDPKPLLEKYAGKPLPFENPKTERKTGAAAPSFFKFQKYGQSGMDVSEIFPHLGSCIDEFTMIRSMVADLPNHEPSLLLMNCGDPVMSRPSVGSWLNYGLGTENQNLPGFISMCPGGYPLKASENWRAGFLPAVYQGTYIDTQHTKIEKLIEHIRNSHASLKAQREQLDLLRSMNEDYLKRREDDGLLEARIESFELAYRMQLEAADAFDVSKEPKHIREMYGSGVHGRQMLIARRLIERGVRCVQLWHGDGQPWDSHEQLRENYPRFARECDQPIGALIKDLKQRGLLDETLVVIGGEFGRTPVVELVGDKEPTGRDHNPFGFTTLLAGGGVKRGYIHGATDEFGFKAIENKVHVHDLHATILHLFGFDHEKFTYRYAGRDFRLTDVHGHVVREILA